MVKSEANHHKLLSPEQDHAIREKYEHGVTTRQLMDEYGFAGGTISSAIRRAGGRMRLSGNRPGVPLLKRRVFTTEQDRTIATEYAAGVATPQLAKKYGCSKRTIILAIGRAGGRLRTNSEAKKGLPSKRRLYTSEQDQAIYREYQEGESAIQLAKKYGGEAGTIASAIRRAGGKLRSLSEARRGRPMLNRRRFTPEQDRFIAACYLDGVSATELAEHYDCSLQVVHDAIRRTGATVRKSNIENTKPERVLRKAIWDLGVMIDEPLPGELRDPRLPGRMKRVSYDMRIDNVYVFVDGCLPHDCPDYKGKYPKNWRSEGKATRTRGVMEFFRNSGSRHAVRVWEHELYEVHNHTSTVHDTRSAALRVLGQVSETGLRERCRPGSWKALAQLLEMPEGDSPVDGTLWVPPPFIAEHRLGRVFTPSQDRIVASEYAKGLTTIELARNYGCCTQAVSNAIKRAGGKLRTRSDARKGRSHPMGPLAIQGRLRAAIKLRNFPDEQDRTIAEEYASGASTVDLARKYSCHALTINKAIRRAGGKLRTSAEGHKGKPSKRRLFSTELDRAIAMEYANGASSTQLAEKYNSTKHTIRNAVARAGGRLRTQSEAQRRFTPEQDLTVASKYLSGASAPQLAKEYGYSVQAIKDAIIRAGSSMRTLSEARKGRPLPKLRRFTTVQESEIATRYAAGETTTQLAKTYAATAATICSAIRRAGGLLRHRGTLGGRSLQSLQGSSV